MKKRMSLVMAALLAVLLVAAFAACGGGDDDLDPPPPPPSVYIVGAYIDGPYSVGCYWVDGELKTLEIPEEATSSDANGITVANGSVYVSGQYYDGNIYKSVPCYWEDGKITKLEPTDCWATGIAVVGKDIYLAGYKNGGGPIYWKNGTQLATLPAGSASAMAVAGNGDVHIAGSESAGKYIAFYWDGTTRINLESSANSKAHAIVLSGTDVYISGLRNNGSDDVACYWKVGGSEVEVCDVDSCAYAITAVGSDIYTAGCYNDSSNDVACYWKGKAKKDLKPSGSTWSEASGIAVVNGSVYVSVSYSADSGKDKACYYKDGVKQPDLPKPEGAGDYYASGICVK